MLDGTGAPAAGSVGFPVSSATIGASWQENPAVAIYARSVDLGLFRGCRVHGQVSSVFSPASQLRPPSARDTIVAMHPDEQLLTIPEAAAELDFSRRTVARLIDDGILPA